MDSCRWNFECARCRRPPVRRRQSSGRLPPSLGWSRLEHWIGFVAENMGLGIFIPKVLYIQYWLKFYVKFIDLNYVSKQVSSLWSCRCHHYHCVIIIVNIINITVSLSASSLSPPPCCHHRHHHHLVTMFYRIRHHHVVVIIVTLLIS